jgi:hypothetical protein
MPPRDRENDLFPHDQDDKEEETVADDAAAAAPAEAPAPAPDSQPAPGPESPPETHDPDAETVVSAEEYGEPPAGRPPLAEVAEERGALESRVDPDSPYAPEEG